jgi:DNA-binding MarR family transcriptional regulator
VVIITDKTSIAPKVVDLKLRLVEVLASFQRAYARWVESPLQNSDLTHARIRLLGVLSRKGPQIMSALSDELVVSPRNVTVVVDALEANGLARRHPHPSDRRAIIVELTPLGVETGAALYAEHAEAVSELFSDLSKADQKELFRLLNLLGGGLERRGVIAEYPRNEA